MTELYTVTLAFRGGRTVNLVFAGAASAKKEFDKLTAGWSRHEDHFGSVVALPDEYSLLEAVMLQEVDKAQEANVEIALVQARAQAKANTRAQHDPQLKFMSGGLVVPGGRMG